MGATNRHCGKEGAPAVAMHHGPGADHTHQQVPRAMVPWALVVGVTEPLSPGRRQGDFPLPSLWDFPMKSLWCAVKCFLTAWSVTRVMLGAGATKRTQLCPGGICKTCI